MESPLYLDTITYFYFFHIFSHHQDNYILLKTVAKNGTRYFDKISKKLFEKKFELFGQIRWTVSRERQKIETCDYLH